MTTSTSSSVRGGRGAVVIDGARTRSGTAAAWWCPRARATTWSTPRGTTSSNSYDLLAARAPGPDGAQDEGEADASEEHFDGKDDRIGPRERRRTRRIPLSTAGSNGQDMADDIRPPLPPFTRETAIQKVRMAEDAWNTRDAVKVSGVYTRTAAGAIAPSSRRSRRDRRVPEAKWARELDYRLIKEVWAFGATASRFASRTSGATTRATGSARTATRTGSSTRRLGWPCATRRSTTCRSPRMSASSAGPSAGAPTTPRALGLGL